MTRRAHVGVRGEEMKRRSRGGGAKTTGDQEKKKNAIAPINKDKVLPLPKTIKSV